MQPIPRLTKIDDWRWRVEQTGDMLSPGMVYASEKMVPHIVAERAAEQVANVACLPGIVGASLAMPDVHWGYGFPIGGVAAFDIESGVVSPGGVGYDINCGVRLLRTNLTRAEIKVAGLIDELFRHIPSGVGSTGKITLSLSEVKQVLEKGAQWAVKRGFGSSEDIEHTEESGTMNGADPDAVSARAATRGREQLGTLGAGNHFLEIQEVVEIFDEKAAAVFGLFAGQITVMIHTGSRGLGYQVCDDNAKSFVAASERYSIHLPDRQLACAPVSSPEGKKYFSAMAAAANYAWANRQLITHWTREVFAKVSGRPVSGIGLELIYDVAHNIAKREKHEGKEVLVHRKGATRAFAAGHSDIPLSYKEMGQPVILPGTMGTASYVLVGTDGAMKETWGSNPHGAGRVMSRSEILKKVRGEQLKNRLASEGIYVVSESWKTLAEEAPEAYKDISEVVEVCVGAGISKKVARMRPLGVIKG
ncbi:MAG: RtcB family protein [Endomicrobiia bacterium]|nr:RtcB family protein [Endomicrobiia bacterium]